MKTLALATAAMLLASQAQASETHVYKATCVKSEIRTGVLNEDLTNAKSLPFLCDHVGMSAMDNGDMLIQVGANNSKSTDIGIVIPTNQAQRVDNDTMSFPIIRVYPPRPLVYAKQAYLADGVMDSSRCFTDSAGITCNGRFNVRQQDVVFLINIQRKR